MKRVLCALTAMLTLCGALALGPAAARAECTTQGALALALAELLKLNVTTADEAAARLATLGVAPDGGWKPAECLTPEASAQIQAAYAAAAASSAGGLAAGGFDAALQAVQPDRQLQDISPSKP